MEIMDWVWIFLFLANIFLIMSSIFAFIDDEGKKRYVIWTLCLVVLSTTFFLGKYSRDQEHKSQTELTEDIPSTDFYQFQIGEKITVKFLSRSNEKYKIGYIGEQNQLKWMDIKEDDRKGVLVEVKYDENRKTAEFVREKNVPKEEGGYKKHYVLYIGNETTLSSSEHTEGSKNQTTVQDDIIQKK